MTRLGLAPAHVRAARVSTLDGLPSGFRRKLDALVAGMREDGHPPIVFETWRTDARQAYLFGYGREWDDGRGVVTNSRTGATTWHGYGLAADLVCADRQHDATPGFWRSMGEHARRVGLEWGGDWAGFPDRPHVQWSPMRRSPSTIAQAAHREGRIADIWRLVGADT